MAETFVNKTVALGNTVDVSVYSPAAATTAIVIHCQVANVDGSSAADLSMDLYDTSATTAAAIVSTLSVPADSAVNPVGGKLVLETGDELRAWASATGDLELTLGILEIT
jgi:hypothetical protein